MIRYSKLGYVELNVTDLKRSKPFYEELVGLEFAGKGAAGELRFRCSEDPYAVVLHQSPTAGFKRVGWMLEDESQFDNLYRRLKQADIPYENLSPGECEDRFIGRACRISEPFSGGTVEFYILPPQWQAKDWHPTVAKIQRLGHVALWTPQKQQAVDFYQDVLNFKHSDSIGDVVTFFRCFPNPYHHGFGIGKRGHAGFHHLNFMVTEIDDIGRGLHRLKKHDVPIMKGPGRHPASGSVFLYYLDPDNLTLEYSFGMEEFPEVDPREGRVLPLVPESTDIWDAPIDPRYAKSGEIEHIDIAGAA